MAVKEGVTERRRKKEAGGKAENGTCCPGGAMVGMRTGGVFGCDRHNVGVVASDRRPLLLRHHNICITDYK